MSFIDTDTDDLPLHELLEKSDCVCPPCNVPRTLTARPAPCDRTHDLGMCVPIVFFVQLNPPFRDQFFLLRGNSMPVPPQVSQKKQRGAPGRHVKKHQKYNSVE